MKTKTAIIGLNSYLFSQFFGSKKRALITHFATQRAKYPKGLNKEAIPNITNLSICNGIELENLIIVIDKFEEPKRYLNIIEQVSLYLHKDIVVYVVAPKINAFKNYSELSVVESSMDIPFSVVINKLLSKLLSNVKKIYIYNYYNPLSVSSEVCSQIVLKANRYRGELCWTDIKQLVDTVLFETTINKKKLNSDIVETEVITHISQNLLIPINSHSVNFGLCLNTIPEKEKFDYKIRYSFPKTTEVLNTIIEAIKNKVK